MGRGFCSIDALGIDRKLLDDKKQQTTYKIQYITKYVLKWLKVFVNLPHVRRINFIDCMCNAGIYLDGDLGTATEVCKLFCSEARNHPEKQFNVFVNDADRRRSSICGNLCESLISQAKTANVSVFPAAQDVNEYLSCFSLFDGSVAGKDAATILFVDPYSAQVVHLDAMQNFVQRYYCELFFNWFTMDFNRNKNNQCKDNITDCVKGIISNGSNPIEGIRESLLIGPMRYSFTYPFRNLNNAEVYRIIFFTPHSKGLELLKDVLWEVFSGSEFHRNRVPKNEQIALFSEDDNREMRAGAYAEEAKRILHNELGDRDCFSYKDMEEVLLENTMLRSGQYLKMVIKPLVQNGTLIKLGLVDNGRNWKKDNYRFGTPKG